MRISHKAFSQFLLLAIAMTALQLLLIPLADAAWARMSVQFVCSLLLLCSARSAGAMPALCAGVFTPIAGYLQGVVPSFAVAFLLGVGNALWVSLFMANAKRSVLWGILVAAVLKSAYLYLALGKLLFLVFPALQAWDPLLASCLYGWRQVACTVAAGLMSLPALFFIQYRQESAQLTPQGEDMR